MARGEASRPGPVAPARVRRARAWGRHRDALFVLPWLVGFGLWSAGPLLANLALSLLHWDLISAPRFAGLAHYRAMGGPGDDHPAEGSPHAGRPRGVGARPLPPQGAGPGVVALHLRDVVAPQVAGVLRQPGAQPGGGRGRP